MWDLETNEFEKSKKKHVSIAMKGSSETRYNKCIHSREKTVAILYIK